MFTRIAMVLCLTLGVSMTLTGCGNSVNGQAASDNRGRVAVVDLDKVAVALGWADELKQHVTAKGQELDVKFNALREDMRTTFEAERKKAGETPTDEQKNKLNQMAMELNRRLGETQNLMQNELGQVRLAAITKYRELIRPIARQVAEQRGYSVVIVPLDNVLWYEPSSDLTDAVVDELLRNKPATGLSSIPSPSSSTTPASPSTPTPPAPPAGK